MKIWVDADASPNPIKDILFRAAVRTQTHIVLVANAAVKLAPSPFITSVQVSQGFDEADNYIVARVSQGDLVITADIPLAADVIEKGGYVISPHGEKYTKNNIQQRLTLRNFMEEMRNNGEQTGGPKPFSNADKQAFGNALDGFLGRSVKFER